MATLNQYFFVRFLNLLTHMASQWKLSNSGDRQFFQQIAHKWNFPSVSLPENDFFLYLQIRKWRKNSDFAEMWGKYIEKTILKVVPLQWKYYWTPGIYKKNYLWNFDHLLLKVKWWVSGTKILFHFGLVFCKLIFLNIFYFNSMNTFEFEWKETRFKNISTRTYKN